MVNKWSPSCGLYPESIAWFIENRAFSPPYYFVSSNPFPPPPSPVRKSCLPFSVFLYVTVELTDEREGVGEEPNHGTARRPGYLWLYTPCSRLIEYSFLEHILMFINCFLNFFYFRTGTECGSPQGLSRTSSNLCLQVLYTMFQWQKHLGQLAYFVLIKSDQRCQLAEYSAA